MVYQRCRYEQEGHLIRPFSLHAVQILKPVFSLYTLRLPSQFSQSMNLYPPHSSHTPAATGNPPSSFFSSPVSCNCLISSAPPTYLPPMKTLGKLSFFLPKIPFNSSKNPASIDRSRSSTFTRNPRKIDRTVLQSSKVLRTTLRLVK